MFISTTQIVRPRVHRAGSNATKQTGALAPNQNDQVSLSDQSQDSETCPSTFASGHLRDAGKVAGQAALGAVPVVGIGVNYMELLNFGMGQEMGTAAVAFAGVAANVLGTLSLAGGAITGHHTALTLGAGLLAGSGLAAGICSYQDN